jgi:hypothetical protein
MNEGHKEILKKLDAEEISALAYGFPLPNTDYYDDYENFSNDLTSTGSTTDANGDWKPLDKSSFDGFDFIDEDYENFLTKKSRERRKRKKQLRKEEGLTRKEARKQAVEEIPRTTIKEVAQKVGGGLKKVGRGIVIGAVAVPRASFLSLVAINYRGFGWKLDNIINLRNGTPASAREKLEKKWYKLGGNWDKLQKAIRTGAKKKKPFFCGKKCKRKLTDANAYKRFSNFNADELDFNPYFNAEPTTITAAAVGTWVGIGSSVIGAVSPIIKLAVDSKQQKEALKVEQEVAEQSLAEMSESEKRQIALAEEKLRLDADPKKMILANPNLTAQEKDEALKQLSDAESKETETNFKKYALYGGLAIVGIFLITKIIKRKK